MPSAIVYAIVSAVVTAGVNKVIQLATGQDLRRTTFGIGPLQFSVGKGKPSFGLGWGPEGSPLSVGFMVGKGRKPSWGVGLKLTGAKTKTWSADIVGSYGWSGSEWQKGKLGIGVSVSKISSKLDVPSALRDGSIERRSDGKFIIRNKVGKVMPNVPSKTTKTLWKAGLKGKYNIEKKTYGIELSGKKQLGKRDGWVGGGIKLTKPKKGKPYITLDTFFQDTDKGKVAVGVTLGKGKPAWKFGTGINLGKDFRVDFNAKTLGSHLDNWNVGLTKYSIPDFGKTKKQQLKGTYKYNPDTNLGNFEFKSGLPIPITLNFGKKGFKMDVNTQNIADVLVDRLLPKAIGKGSVQKIDYALQELILKGAKGLAGGKLSPGTMKILSMIGFGGKKGEVFQKAVPGDYTRWAQSFLPKTTEKLNKWQTDFLATDAAQGFGKILRLSKDRPSIYDVVKFPSRKNIITNDVFLQDFLAGSSLKTLDSYYANLRDYLNMPARRSASATEYLRSMTNMDPRNLASALNSAITKSKTKEDIINNLSDSQRKTILGFAMNSMTGFVERAKGLGNLVSQGLYGVGQFGKTYDKLIWGNLKDPAAWSKFFKGDKQALFSEQQRLLGPALKGVAKFAGGVVSSPVDYWISAFDDLPYQEQDFRTANEKGEGNRYAMMLKANNSKVWNTLSNRLYKDAWGFISNLFLLSSVAGKGLNLAGGISRRAGATLSDKALLATDPFVMIGKGTNAALKKFSGSSFADLFKGAAGKIQTRVDLSNIVAKSQAAKLFEASRKQKEAASIVKNLKQFSDIDQVSIGKAAIRARFGNFDDVLPQHLKGNKAALEAARQFRELSDINTSYLYKEAKLLPIEQLNNRRFAPLKAEFKKLGASANDKKLVSLGFDADDLAGWRKRLKDLSNEDLMRMGYDPAYIPSLVGKQGFSKAENTIDMALDSIWQKKFQPYKEGLDNIERLDLSVATLDHQRILGEMKALSEAINKVKKMPGVKRFDIKKGSIDKGKRLVDLDGTQIKLLQQADFVDDYIINLKKMNADKAMAATLGKWYGTEKILQLRNSFPKGIELYEVPTYTANIIKSNFGKRIKVPLWSDVNAAVKDSVLAFRPAWIVNDFKNNAINYLLSGRNPLSILRALKEKYNPLLPAELSYSGWSAQELASPPPSGFYGRLLTFGDKVTGGKLTKFKKTMYDFDRIQDTAFKRGFVLSDLEKAARRKTVENASKSFFLADSELRNLTTEMLENWRRDPAKYESTVKPIAEKSMAAMNDWIYSYENVWPLLTKNERGLLKEALFFPEIGYWGIKKIAMMPVKHPAQALLLDKIGNMYQEWESGKDTPDFLAGATKIAENTFLRPLSGTLYDAQTGAFNFQNLGMLSPALKTLVEYGTGIDLRTMKPFTSSKTPWQYNPKTNRFESLGQLRETYQIDSDVKKTQNELNELYSKAKTEGFPGTPGFWQTLKSKTKFLQNQLKDFQAEKEAVEDFRKQGLSLAELTLRNLPQYQWFEQALVPFRQYTTSTLLNPSVIIDKETGKPKHPINRWMIGLRMLGIPISQFDLDEWQKKEETRNLRDISYSFKEMLNNLSVEKPALLQKILAGMKDGTIPWTDPNFEESPLFRMPRSINVQKLKLPELMPTKDLISAAAEAKRIEIEQVKKEKENAYEMLDALGENFSRRMKPAIDALTDQRTQQIKTYYDSMLDEQYKYKLYNSLLQETEIVDKLKEYEEMPVDSYDLSKKIINNLKDTGSKIGVTIKDFSAAIQNYFNDTIARGATPSLEEMAGVFSSQLNSTIDQFTAAASKGMQSIISPEEFATTKAMDEWEKEQLSKMAFDNWRKNLLDKQRLGIPKMDMDKAIENQISQDILDTFSRDLIETPWIDIDELTGQSSLDTALTEIESTTQAMLDSIKKMSEEGKFNTKIKNLVVKGLVDRRDQIMRKLRHDYKSKQRMKGIFTPEKIEKAEEVLAAEIDERKSFLAELGFDSWAPHFDPSLADKKNKIPVTAWLTALAASRMEGVDRVGVTGIDDYLASETGSGFLNFETELLSVLSDIMPSVQATEDELTGPAKDLYQQTVTQVIKQYASQYKEFLKEPTMNRLKSLYNLHSASIGAGKGGSGTPGPVGNIPTIRFTDDGSTEVAMDKPSWDSSKLSTKMSELETYSRTYAAPAAQTYESSVEKSLKTLLDRQASKTAWFTGVLLQK